MSNKLQSLRSQSTQLFMEDGLSNRCISKNDIRNKYLNKLIERDFQRKKTIVQAESSLYEDVSTKKYLQNARNKRFDTSKMLSYDYIEKNYHRIHCETNHRDQIGNVKVLKNNNKKNSKVYKKLKKLISHGPIQKGRRKLGLDSLCENPKNKNSSPALNPLKEQSNFRTLHKDKKQSNLNLSDSWNGTSSIFKTQSKPLKSNIKISGEGLDSKILLPFHQSGKKPINQQISFREESKDAYSLSQTIAHKDTRPTVNAYLAQKGRNNSKIRLKSRRYTEKKEDSVRLPPIISMKVRNRSKVGQARSNSVAMHKKMYSPVKRIFSTDEPSGLDSKRSISQEQQQEKLREIRNLCFEAEIIDKETLRDVNAKCKLNKYFENEFDSNLDILTSCKDIDFKERFSKIFFDYQKRNKIDEKVNALEVLEEYQKSKMNPYTHIARIERLESVSKYLMRHYSRKKKESKRLQ
ncbi:unnamed protein product [Moneuplotes crassus]|uniref:Uncharacterized protein n=1 Tax=Euplotes crassus TaxID=5936 RepID=A0AAD1Y861_EUPCR|nr:unnamed protein product [Moneuplotes crassus]